MALWGTITLHVWLALGTWCLFLIYRRIEANSGAMVMVQKYLDKISEAQLGDTVYSRAHNEEKLDALKAELQEMIHKLKCWSPDRN